MTFWILRGFTLGPCKFGPLLEEILATPLTSGQGGSRYSKARNKTCQVPFPHIPDSIAQGMISTYRHNITMATCGVSFLSNKVGR